jgi:peroxiredoxin
MKFKLFALIFWGFYMVNTMGHAQRFFNLSGKLKNPDGVSLTLYRNWVESPVEYELKLDKSGNFKIEFPLNEIAYCDLNLGIEGLYFLLIEPDDQIYLSADLYDFENTFTYNGKGSEKWKTQEKILNFFEKEKDWEVELENLKNISKKGYFELTQFLLKEQLEILYANSEGLSNDVVSLIRADIFGKMSTFELNFLILHKLFNQEEFDRFELKTFNAKTQSKSFYLGTFVEYLIDNHNNLAQKYSSTKYIEYESLKSYFDKLELVNREVIERILASKIINFLDSDGLDEETKLIVEDFKMFCRNKIFLNAVLAKFQKFTNLLPGKTAFNFILPDSKNNLVSLKDFRGKNVFMSFYSSWCGPCIHDLGHLYIVNSYFKPQNDLVFISIALDNKETFKDLIKTVEWPGVHLVSDENLEILENYFTESLPNYLIIDKTGTIISEKIIQPSEDEGRALIKQIERIVYKK